MNSRLLKRGRPDLFFDVPALKSSFRKWFDETVAANNPGIVVALARGAVRLIQMTRPSSLEGIELVSNHALPFYSDDELRGRRVLLVDDSVIFGSTMAAVYHQLTEKGATVDCASFAVDRNVFYGEDRPKPSKYSYLPLSCKERLESSEIRKHHAAIVRNVTANPLDYNLDFATVVVHVENLSKWDVPYLISRISTLPCVQEEFEVTSSISANRSIYRHTFYLTTQCEDVVASGQLEWCAPPKIRLVVAPEYNLLLFTPTPVLQMGCGATFDSVSFIESSLSQTWSRLHAPEDRDAKQYPKAVLRLASTFTSCEIAGRFANEVVTTLLRSGFVTGEPFLDEFDLACLVGHANRKALVEQFGARKQDTLPEDQRRQLKLYNHSCAANLRVADLVRQHMYNTKRLKPHPREPLHESYGKIFLALREVTDNDEVRFSTDFANRLEDALTLNDIHATLSAFDIRVSPMESSSCLDICVDNGLAVPKFVVLGDTVVRAFYCGEDEDDQSTQQLKSELFQAYKEHLDDGLPELSPFDMTKLCAIIRERYMWMPVNARFGPYGMRSYIGTEALEGWLTDPATGAMTVEYRKGRGKRLVLGSDFEPVVDSTWDNWRHEFQDAFAHIAAAFAKRSTSDDVKLLLSTCRTKRHTFNAIAFEADQWAHNAKFSIHQAIRSLTVALRRGHPLSGGYLTALFWSVEYVNESLKKNRVFSRDFAKTLDDARKAFGGRSEFRWFKNHLLRFISSNDDPEVDGDYRRIVTLLPPMAYVTAYLYCALKEADNNFERTAEKFFRGQGRMLWDSQYDWLRNGSLIENARFFKNAKRSNNFASLWTCELADVEIPSHFGGARKNQLCLEAINSVVGVAKEVADSVSIVAKVYRQPDDGFPYSPVGRQRVRLNGDLEDVLQQSYLLMFDIIGSTDSRQALEFRRECRDVLKKVTRATKGAVDWEDTSDDCMKIWSSSVDRLVFVAGELAHLGDKLRLDGDTFDGTRKSIGRGRFLIVTNSERHKRIEDGDTQDVIPRTQSILAAIDGDCSGDERNYRIMLTPAAHETASQESQFIRDHSESVRVRTRHFSGTCYRVVLQR